MHVAVGHSEDLDSHDAILEVLDACADRLSGQTPQAGLLFAGIDHDFEGLSAAVLERYPGLQFIGGSTDGEISSLLGFAQDSVALMLLRSDRVGMQTGVGLGVTVDPVAAARQAVAEATAGQDDTRLCIIVGEGLGVDSQQLLSAVQDALPPGAVVCGGMAADQLRLSHTIQFGNGRVLRDALVVLCFTGPVRVSHAVGSGWTPLGAFHTVTDSRGHIVHRIDDRPARELYEEYFGALAVSVMSPLAVYPDGGDDFFVVGPNFVTDDGGVAFNLHVPVGARVRWADATIPEVIDAASETTRRATAGFPAQKPDFALVVSCAARRVTLGTRTGEEIELLRQRLGTHVPTVGWYAYGEVCPLAGTSTARMHNYTLVSVLVGED